MIQLTNSKVQIPDSPIEKFPIFNTNPYQSVGFEICIIDLLIYYRYVHEYVYILERDSRDQSDRGDESISSAESVEDSVLPLSRLVHLVPPVRHSSNLHGRRRAQWHSRHFRSALPLLRAPPDNPHGQEDWRERERESEAPRRSTAQTGEREREKWGERKSNSTSTRRSEREG